MTRRSLKFCWQQIPIDWQGVSDIPAPPGYGVMPFLLHRGIRLYRLVLRRPGKSDRDWQLMPHWRIFPCTLPGSAFR
ncbi:hypothetical protein EHS86_00355 [Erwinia amylovora]|uniref:Uncharacterized protein n=1 Tax=Erwinia amylovora (strain CFBP1430) TaxID=665029 RepID=D4I0D7_ERWAC|nr:hypothetical protein AD997_07100 [Erwinia amylovora]CBA20344.1 hypothetical protein predicted by Glimmer/Critica [Erwinia amylovora CFBP1430]CCO82039.1 hypothetical protein BN433_1456 [Erwinia amylovora Ea266]CCO85835.1 hypothetical protein BN434_1436 [Erwinia amylovora CFBP 2585]CCO89622.1 hypothetical protein BN435_1439 [Erwinia amylovora 01SFR-BO]CCO98731.1 hypothetical protein BN438_1438 [Erwinia amylovora UPN527]